MHIHLQNEEEKHASEIHEFTNLESFFLVSQFLDKDGRTPLILACTRGDLFEMVLTLLNLGANINAYRPGNDVSILFFFVYIFHYKVDIEAEDQLHVLLEVTLPSSSFVSIFPLQS